MTRTQLVQKINLTLNSVPNVSGIHSDLHWTPIHALQESLSVYDASCTKSDYEHDQTTGTPVRKVWLYEIPHVSEKTGKTNPVYVRVVAAGAGSVAEPLERYDVTAYAS